MYGIESMFAPFWVVDGWWLVVGARTGLASALIRPPGHKARQMQLTLIEMVLVLGRTVWKA